MVAVGGGEESGLTEILFQIIAGQVIVCHFGYIPSKLTGDVFCHGEGAAQNLEGIQAEAVAFVLDAQRVQAQVGGHAIQLGQWRNGVLRKAPVECPRLGDVFQGHDAQFPVLAARKGIQFPFDFGFHRGITS